jgi:hypothetical protein
MLPIPYVPAIIPAFTNEQATLPRITLFLIDRQSLLMVCS